MTLMQGGSSTLNPKTQDPQTQTLGPKPPGYIIISHSHVPAHYFMGGALNMVYNSKVQDADAH